MADITVADEIGKVASHVSSIGNALIITEEQDE